MCTSGSRGRLQERLIIAEQLNPTVMQQGGLSPHPGVIRLDVYDTSSSRGLFRAVGSSPQERAVK